MKTLFTRFEFYLALQGFLSSTTHLRVAKTTVSELNSTDLVALGWSLALEPETMQRCVEDKNLCELGRRHKSN